MVARQLATLKRSFFEIDPAWKSIGTAVIFDGRGGRGVVRKWSDIRETTSFPWIEGTLYIEKLDSVRRMRG